MSPSRRIVCSITRGLPQPKQRAEAATSLETAPPLAPANPTYPFSGSARGILPRVADLRDAVTNCAMFSYIECLSAASRRRGRIEERSGRPAFTVRDQNGQALAYVYFEEEPGRRAGQHASTRLSLTAQIM